MRRILILLICFPLLQSCALLTSGDSRELPRAKGFQVLPPATWKETSTKGESDQAYLTSSKSIATLTTSCGTPTKASLETLTKQLLVGIKSIKFKERKKLSVDGFTGLYSEIHSTLDEKPFFLLVYVLPATDCVFDFTLVGPKEFSSAEKQEFLSFIESFKNGTK